MKTKILSLAFLALLTCSSLVEQANLLQPVVRITAQIEGVGEEVGAGLIAGTSGDKLYLVTAPHVVERYFGAHIGSLLH